MDSSDWRRVLSTLVAKVPKHVIIGVGTVMDDSVHLLAEIASLGLWSLTLSVIFSPFLPVSKLMGPMIGCHFVKISFRERY